jgi:hypothetical protein
MTCKDCLHYEACDEQKKINYKLSKSVCKRFKDKSRFIELPCRVGDVVYDITLGNAKKQKVISIAVLKSSVTNSLFIHCGNYRNAILTHGLTDFGKTVFLSREEAEKALKEQVGEK